MKFKTIFFSIFMLASVLLTSCGGKKTPIVEQCPACHGEKICQICQGNGQCPSCQGTGKCDVCQGNGKCQTCHGTGQVRAKCSVCHGYGFLPPKIAGNEPIPCSKCKATGLAPKGQKAPCPDCVIFTKAFQQRVKSGKIDLKQYKKDVKNSNFAAIAKALKGIKKGTGECSACEGTGKCQTCKGTGKCTVCEGTGECPECKGTGHKIDSIQCPHCYAKLKYGIKKCPKCGTEFTYEKLGKNYKK